MAIPGVAWMRAGYQVYAAATSCVPAPALAAESSLFALVVPCTHRRRSKRYVDRAIVLDAIDAEVR